MKAEEENPFGVPTGYAIYLEWDRERRESSDVLDISPEHQSTRNYSATLAHKVNHSFNPNCEWVHVQVRRLTLYLTPLSSLLTIYYLASLLWENPRNTNTARLEGRRRTVHPLRV